MRPSPSVIVQSLFIDFVSKFALKLWLIAARKISSITIVVAFSSWLHSRWRQTTVQPANRSPRLCSDIGTDLSDRSDTTRICSAELRLMMIAAMRMGEMKNNRVGKQWVRERTWRARTLKMPLHCVGRLGMMRFESENREWYGDASAFGGPQRQLTL